jgi:hypothetical protein
MLAHGQRSDASRQAEEPQSHRWRRIRLGRVCELCHLAQAPPEFDDTIACSASAVAEAQLAAREDSKDQSH